MCILTTMMTYFPFLFDYPSLPFHILEIFIAPIILFLCIKIHLQTNCSNSNSAFHPDSNTGRHSNNANFQTTNIFTPHFLLHVNRSYKKKTRVIYLESLIFFKRTGRIISLFIISWQLACHLNSPNITSLASQKTISGISFLTFLNQLNRRMSKKNLLIINI